MGVARNAVICFFLFLFASESYALPGGPKPSENVNIDLFVRVYKNAEELLKSGDLLGAYIEFSTAEDYAPDNVARSTVRVKLGDILFRWGDTQAAEFMYREAYFLDKRNKEALRKVVISKAENLSDDFHSYLRLVPDDLIDSEILFYYGKYVLRKEKRPIEACNILDSVRRESDFFPKASYVCGVAMLMIGDRDEAVRRFMNAFVYAQDEKLRENSQLAIARIYADMGRFAEAITYYLEFKPTSPVFYEARYETCWILYSLERYSDVQSCIDYFKRIKRSYLSRRLDVLEAFLYMDTDLVRSFLTFAAISDYSEAFLSKIIETQNFGPKFWKKDAISYFSSVEPDIGSWLDFFPEYSLYKERVNYISRLREEINSTLAHIERLKSMSVMVADRSIKRYFEMLYDIQTRIHRVISSFILSGAQLQERNLMLSLFSVFEELKNMDFKTRELVALASMNLYKTATEKEFKNWEKKYGVYNESLKGLMSELENIMNFQRKNSEYITRMVEAFAARTDDSGKVLGDFILIYNDSIALFFEFSKVWEEVMKSVIRYVEVQEKKLRKIKSVLDSFSDYIEAFEGTLLKYIFLFRVKREVEKTYALARYGFVETSWVMKERESAILDRLYMIRIEEENKLRNTFLKFFDEVNSITVRETAGTGNSMLETELSQAMSYIDEINGAMERALNIMFRVSKTSWREPEKTIQELIEEKERERKKLLEKFEGIIR